MGEAKQKKSATQILIAKYPHCYFCAGRRQSSTREHMPPLALFDNSHRPDKLVMPACDTCNRETSTADLVAAIISRWGLENSEQSLTDHRRLANRLRNQDLEIFDEWRKIQEIRQIKARRHLRNQGVNAPLGASVAVIGPLTVRQLNLFAHKVTLALHFEHFRKPLPASGAVCAFWRSKEDFFLKGVPLELQNMFPQYATLTQGRWETKEIFEYKSTLHKSDGLFGCVAKFRQNIFVVGFSVVDQSMIKENLSEWISPDDPKKILENPHYQIKN